MISKVIEVHLFFLSRLLFKAKLGGPQSQKFTWKITFYEFWSTFPKTTCQEFTCESSQDATFLK